MWGMCAYIYIYIHTDTIPKLQEIGLAFVAGFLALFSVAGLVHRLRRPASGQAAGNRGWARKTGHKIHGYTYVHKIYVMCGHE